MNKHIETYTELHGAALQAESASRTKSDELFRFKKSVREDIEKEIIESIRNVESINSDGIENYNAVSFNELARDRGNETAEWNTKMRGDISISEAISRLAELIAREIFHGRDYEDM